MIKDYKNNLTTDDERANELIFIELSQIPPEIKAHEESNIVVINEKMAERERRKSLISDSSREV